jgi:hypothetical protein
MKQVHCADTITEFISSKLDTHHIDAYRFRCLLLLILENNYFKYENKYYKQIKGIAIGKICGPSLDIINFLDLYIKYDNLTNKLKFWIYTKPTNTFCYLLPSYNHPDRIFNNIIKSLFIRLRRICTDYSDFITASIFCNFNYNLICNSFLNTKKGKYFLYNYNIKCIYRIN